MSPLVVVVVGVFCPSDWAGGYNLIMSLTFFQMPLRDKRVCEDYHSSFGLAVEWHPSPAAATD
jgi:hypothetical protein